MFMEQLFDVKIIMLIIFAAIVSTLVQILKRAMPNAYWMLGLLAVLSIVAAGAYPALVAAGLWETALQSPSLPELSTPSLSPGPRTTDRGLKHSLIRA
jgi:hypothetical protein